MKLAIATASYFNSHHTMVNRHILHMFDGTTCVVCQSTTDAPKLDRPFFDLSKVQPSYLDTVLFNREFEANKLRFLTDKIPWGRQKRRLKSFLKRQKVNFILCEFGPQAIYIAPVANEMNIPVACYFRGFDASAALRKKRYVVAYREVSKMVCAFFSVSQSLLDNLATHGITHKETHVIPSGVDVRKFKPKEKIRNRCIVVGRMIEKKAPMVSLRAFCEIADIVPDATLEMIGGGPLADEALAFIERHRLTDRVWVRGDQPHEKVRNALQKAEVFLQHSVTANDGNTEGLPTSIQEAMACGAVIISTRHSGIPEAVENGVNGFIVDELDVGNYRGALLKALTRDVDVDHMMKMSRRIAVERFDNSKLLEKTEAIIRRIVNEISNG